MTGMLVSSSTIQVWVEWDRVPQDIVDAIPDRRVGDIVVYAPAVVERLEAFEAFAKQLAPEIRMKHPMRAGLILVKRVPTFDSDLPMEPAANGQA